jgi:hypothetical protein
LPKDFVYVVGGHNPKGKAQVDGLENAPVTAPRASLPDRCPCNLMKKKV